MKPKKHDIQQQIRNSYNVDVPDYWDEIESADISKVTKISEKKKGGIVPFYRITAAVACLALIVTAWIITPKILNNSESTLPETKHVRIGTEGELYADIDVPGSFDELVTESSNIMKIRIDKWLGEDDNVFSKTYFECTVIDSIDGKKSKNDMIVLIQNGNSKETLQEYPLFKIGDQFLAFFSLCEIGESVQIENCYRINAMYHSIFDSIQIDGKQYYAKRTPALTDSISSSKLPEDITQKVRDKLIVNDSILAQVSGNSIYNNVYKCEELTDEVISISKEGK